MDILSIIKSKWKQVKYHNNTLEEANAEANNVLVTDDSNPPISIEGLDVSNFFEDPNGKIDHLISGGVIGHMIIKYFWMFLVRLNNFRIFGYF